MQPQTGWQFADALRSAVSAESSEEFVVTRIIRAMGIERAYDCRLSARAICGSFENPSRRLAENKLLHLILRRARKFLQICSDSFVCR
jgi:hypothetical protein